MYVSPFAGLSVPEIYDGLVNGKFGPQWPDKKMQAGYTGTNGPPLLKRAFDFIEILEKDGAFKPDWRGLDYGCGWGRFPSSLLQKGTPEQLDACDAWPVTIRLIEGLGYKNKIFKVSELLSTEDLPAATYDFIMSFSVFTHLSPKAFETNIPVLLSSLNTSGKLYITVRHYEFITHKYEDRGDELRSILSRDDIVFLDSGGDLTGEKVFGDTVITENYLSRFGNVRYLGQPHSLQHVYVIDA